MTALTSGLEVSEDIVREILEFEQGSMLVRGTACSGKTTVLLERYARLVEAGVRSDRILMLVSQQAAARLGRDRLILRLARSLPGVNVLTPRMFAREILERHGLRLSSDPAGERNGADPPHRRRDLKLLSTREQRAFVRALLSNEDATAWPASGHLLRVEGFVEQVSRFLLRLQEYHLDPDEAKKRARGKPYGEEAAGFYARYLQAMISDGALDEASLVWAAAKECQANEGEWVLFEHVLVDDLHDAAASVGPLVRALSGHARSTVAATDPDGGTVEMKRDPVEFRADRVIALPEKPSIAATLEALVREVPLKMNPPPSNMTTHLHAHPGEEADAIAHALTRAHIEDGIEWAQMAVIVRRYGRPVAPILHALSRHRVPYVSGGAVSRLIDEACIEPLCTMLRFVDSVSERPALIENVLCSPIIGMLPTEIRTLRRRARLENRQLLDLAREESPLFAELVGALEECTDDGAAALWYIYRHSSYIQQLIERQEHLALDALTALMSSVEKLGEKLSVSELLHAISDLRFQGALDRYPNAVKVLSVADARSRSFEIVVIPNCIEGEWPSLRGSHALIDANELIAPRSMAERLRDHLARERALFRVAITRGRRATMLFASHSASATSPRTPSRYLEQRLGLEWSSSSDQTEPQRTEPATARSAQAELRVIARDPGSSRIQRLAALEALRRTGDDPSEWWGINEWTDSGNPLISDDDSLITSYSRISVMKNCGLQYLLQVELGLDPDQSYQMWVGSAVHEIIDRAQQGSIETTEEALHATLDQLWEPERFPNRAIEHRRYLDCKRMLSSWLHEESSTPVVKSECEFHYEIEGATVRGKIDAIKRMNNGKLRIIDYKTGTYAPSKNEVKADLQLASYYLATKKVPELAALGEPGSLQLAYIAKPSADREITLLQASVSDVDSWAEDALVDLTRKVRLEQFAPNPDADCRFCKFTQLCPLWPEGAAATQ